MQELLHQPASWGEEWLKRLSGPSNTRELFQETYAFEDVVAQLMKEHQQLEQQQQQVSIEPRLMTSHSQCLTENLMSCFRWLFSSLAEPVWADHAGSLPHTTVGCLSRSTRGERTIAAILDPAAATSSAALDIPAYWRQH